MFLDRVKTYLLLRIQAYSWEYLPWFSAGTWPVSTVGSASTAEVSFRCSLFGFTEPGSQVCAFCLCMKPAAFLRSSGLGFLQVPWSPSASVFLKMSYSSQHIYIPGISSDFRDLTNSRWLIIIFVSITTRMFRPELKAPRGKEEKKEKTAEIISCVLTTQTINNRNYLFQLESKADPIMTYQQKYLNPVLEDLSPCL